MKVKGEVVTDDGKLKEHGEGFGNKIKIPRTPPEERARRAHLQAQQPQVDYAQYYNEGGLSQSPSRRNLNHNLSDPNLLVSQLP